MSGYLAKPDLRKRLAPWQRSRKPVNQEGRIGRLQRSFNSRTMAGWRFWAQERGIPLASAVSGNTAQLVVGHIEDRSTDPALRTDPRNVAPITWSENEEMKFDHAKRREYQAKMRAWVHRYFS